MKRHWLLAIAFLMIAATAHAAPNVMTTQTYSFTIKADTTAPAVTTKAPAAGAINVDPMTPVTLHITDAETGVNQATIVMKVNGTTVAPTISGNKNDYTISYEPTTPFVNGSTVTVAISASDFAN